MATSTATDTLTQDTWVGAIAFAGDDRVRQVRLMVNSVQLPY